MASQSGAASLAPERERLFGERLLLIAILIAALALCAPAAWGLSYLLEMVEFYAHGYLVPFVAGYLGWQRRDEIRAALRDLRPPPLGFLVVLAVGSGEALAVIGDMGFVAGVGIPVVLGAALWATGGARLLRPCLLPLAFLALMIPPPGFVLEDLLVASKEMVTRVSVAILHALGESVSADGNRIEVPGRTLFVADACSGLTSIVSLLPVACVVAYFLTSGLLHGLLVVVSVVPLAVAANVLRVVVTVKLVTAIGPQMAQGWLHDSFGLLTYAVGTAVLVLFARWLR
jgi:exosortase